MALEAEKTKEVKELGLRAPECYEGGQCGGEKGTCHDGMTSADRPQGKIRSAKRHWKVRPQSEPGGSEM